MKVAAFIALAVLATFAPAVSAQMGDMKGMDMKGMDMKSCDDMKGMDKTHCMEMMNKKDGQGRNSGAVHKASGIIKKVDATNGTVSLEHGPVKSLNWPAMTMSFVVKDKKLLEQLAVGKKVDFEFKKEGSDYVLTGMK
jgi:Cu/Ag efflux protein CusF